MQLSGPKLIKNIAIADPVIINALFSNIGSDFLNLLVAMIYTELYYF